MKTISGHVVSTHQISLSKAAKLISRFTASDNEASPAFAAYLRRTSAAFNELVQLQKESHGKKDQYISVIKEGNLKSLRTAGEDGFPSMEVQSKPTDVGLNITGDSGSVKLKKSKKNKGSDGDAGIAVSDVKSVVDNLFPIDEMKNDLPDVGKKSKKKKGMEDHVTIIDNDQTRDDINANEVKVKVKSEMGITIASEELKKKKKKRDKHGKENQDASEIVQSRAHRPDDGVGVGADTSHNIGDALKKHKKSKVKEEKEDSIIPSVGQKDDSSSRHEVKEERVCGRNVETNYDVSGEKKHKRRSHEPERRENGSYTETEAADKKSRKRKHESVTDGEFDGSQEAVRAKKKKIQTVK